MGHHLWCIESEQQSIKKYQEAWTSFLEVNYLSTAKDLFESLETSSHPDVIILSDKCPDMDVFRVCQIFQKLRLVSDIPIIVVSESVESEGKSKALESGAFDYISKPFQIKHLQARVIDAIENRKMLQRLRQSIEEYMAQERKSPLLPIEDNLNLCLQRYYDQACSLQQPLSLFLLEIDQMDIYKAAFGVQQADLLRQRLCEALRKAVPDASIYPHEDTCSLVLYNFSRKDSLRLAEQVLRRIRLLEIPHAAQTSLDYVSVSMGIATLTQADLYDCGHLIKGAEQALFQAKSWGANRVCQFLEL